MLPAIQIQGASFIAAGQPWHYVGVSAFALFRRWLMRDGPSALVAPVLEEWRAVAKAGGYDGPIVLRVFRFAAYPNAFALDPWSYAMSELTTFTQFCGDRGFYVDWTCGDAQLVLPDADGAKGQQQHLNECCAALVGQPTFIETVNEWFKNGVDVFRVVPPVWGVYLRDSGYYSEIQTWQAQANLDFISYHSSRSDGGLSPWPKWLIDMDDQLAVLLHAFQKPVILKEPIGFAEVQQPGRRSNDPAHAFRMGLLAAYGGILFHSDSGLSCDGLGAVQRQCAEAFFSGVTGALRR